MSVDVPLEGESTGADFDQIDEFEPLTEIPDTWPRLST